MGERAGRVAQLRSVIAKTSKPFWRSPPDQPPWARPALLAIAALATLTYAWGMNGAALEAFYGAAARSMSSSWHDFFFGAFDPAGTVSVDKLPGALWPQALSLRVFGFHTWAIVLPQVVEGVLTILVLYRAVRRLAGPVAGIVAAAVVATSPVTVALNRGNVADSLLILLIVLAADATSAALGTSFKKSGTPDASLDTALDRRVTARTCHQHALHRPTTPSLIQKRPAAPLFLKDVLTSGRLRTLLLAGVWVVLAFQAKMTVAWLVLPALAGAYLLAAPLHLRSRLGQLALAGAVTAAVSLSWMTAVSLVPAHDRPYVDGTQNDSVFGQTFDYNGIARLRHGSDVFAGAGHPAPFLVRISQASAGPIHSIAPSWHRLLSGPFGRDDGWLLPAALIAAIAVLASCRRASHSEPLRAAVVLWGLWLIVLGAFFSAGGYPNSYYVAALSPAIGALCGIGVELVWRRRGRLAAQACLAGALLASVAYGIYLLDGGTNIPGWLVPVAVCAAVVGVLALAMAPRNAPATPTGGVLALVLACALLLPGVASALMVLRGLGPFAAPYEPSAATVSRAEAARTRALDEQVVEELSSTYGTAIPMATDSSILAAPYILATGREILPIGGFQGGIPAPTLTQLQRYIETGQVRAFLVPRASDDPRVVWIHAHCAPPPPSASGGRGPTALYDCASS
jgi:4-amino-4-deoxy-L-arabinose transferase-like glycosyltransferase